MTKGNVMKNVTSSQLEASFNAPEDWKPVFSPWRHGGWYVNNTRYPNGGCGCVSNNYPDKKWRIACDERRGELGEPGDFTFPSRAAAARAEYGYVKSLEHGLTLLPQQVAFDVFKRKSVLTPLVNHGRTASVFFNGHDCGFVDAVGIEGRIQAHRSEVNNALYANSPDAPTFLARPLPSRAALADYPDLEEQFPEAAATVRGDSGKRIKGGAMMTSGDLFAELELSDEEKDAQSVLRMNKGSLGRARKVVEHWKDMARDARYEGRNWLTGDCLNPLANREHDALWEAGDGDEVAAAVRHALRGDVNLSRLIVNDDGVKRYVSHRLLDLAREVIALEESRTFAETLVNTIEKIEAKRNEGWNVESMVFDANCLISEQKVHGCIGEQEMQRSYALIQEAAYPGRSIKEAEELASSKGQYGGVEPDKEYAGQVIGVTGAHVVISIGRGAVIAEKRMLDRCPARGDGVSIKFKDGAGVVSVNKEKEQSLGR